MLYINGRPAKLEALKRLFYEVARGYEKIATITKTAKQNILIYTEDYIK